VERDGLGPSTKPPRDPFGVWRRRRRQVLDSGRQWFSPLAYFQGPFDSKNGLSGSEEFFRRTSLNGKPPQIYLAATETRMGIVPIQNAMMRKGRGTQEILWTSYSDIDQIELKPATRSRMSAITPTTSSHLGEVIIGLKRGGTGRLTGTTVEELSQFLVSLGAVITPS
jgi:hypothetical protein